MSFVSTGGGTAKWSQITIDADKDMVGHGLCNLKGVVAGMIGGDLIAKGLGGVLVRIPAGVANQALTSQGPGQVPAFAPGGTYLARYYGAQIYSKYVASLKTPDAIKALNAPVTVGKVRVYLDTPASNVKILTPTVSSTKAVALKTPDQTSAITYTSTNLSRHVDLGQCVASALSYLYGVYTDETTAAQSATANDMHLMAASPVSGDIYYFGYGVAFNYLRLILGIQGVGTWGFTWEYWNGAAWTTFTGLSDPTNNFQAVAGTYNITWTAAAGWTTTTVNGVGPYYWIRARLSSYTSKTTIPLGTQATCMVTGVI